MAKNRPKPPKKTAPVITKEPVKKTVQKTSSASGMSSMFNWLVILALLLPVIYSKSVPDAMMMPRYIFLGFFVLLFITYFFLYKNRQVIDLKPSIIKWVFILGAGFAGWCLISMFGAINMTPAYYETGRHLLLLLLLFIVMVATQQEGSGVFKICTAVMVIAILESLIGILQFSDNGFRDIPGNIIPFGLNANRNLYGSAQLFSVPFSIYVLYKSKKSWRFLSIIALVLTTISLVISQTRSAWLGGFALILGSLLLVSIFSKTYRRKWLLNTGIAVAAIAVIIVLLFETDSDGILKSSVKERIENLAGPSRDSSGSQQNAQERLRIWGKTVLIIKDHPLFGVGPGNWNLAVPKYGTEGLVWAFGEYFPDRPHSAYLQIASETGIPGALLYFGAWLIIVIIGFRVLTRTNSEDQKILTILMLCGMGAFGIDCLFSFPTERFEHSLYFTFMAGIILGMYASLPQSSVTVPSTGSGTGSSAGTGPSTLRQAQGGASSGTGQRAVKKLDKGWIAFFMFIAVFNIFLGFKKISFEKAIGMTKAYYKAGQYQTAIDVGEKGKTSWITVDPIGESIELFSGLAWKDMKKYDKALKEEHIARKYHPNSVMVFNNTGTIFTEMQQYDSAISNYKKALELAPHFQIPLKNLAVNYFVTGRFAECVKTFGQIEMNNDPYLTSMLKDAQDSLKLRMTN